MLCFRIQKTVIIAAKRIFNQSVFHYSKVHHVEHHRKQRSKMDLKDKVALITGAASGLGLAITKEFLRDGIKGITMADVNPENGKQVCEQLCKEFGKRICFHKTDVTNEHQFEEAFKKTISHFGRVDVVINNAGIANEVNYALTVNINLTAVIRGTTLGLKYMSKEHGCHGGIILNTSSIAAVAAQEIFPVYAATKAGVLNLCKGWGHPVYHDKTGVRIVALCPGFTETPIQEKGVLHKDTMNLLAEQKYQKAESVGRAALYVVKHGASGSGWMIDQCQLYLLECPKWETYAKVVGEKM